MAPANVAPLPPRTGKGTPTETDAHFAYRCLAATMIEAMYAIAIRDAYFTHCKRFVTASAPVIATSGSLICRQQNFCEGLSSLVYPSLTPMYRRALGNDAQGACQCRCLSSGRSSAASMAAMASAIDGSIRANAMSAFCIGSLTV